MTNHALPWDVKREAFVRNVEAPGMWLLSAKVLESAASYIWDRLMSATIAVRPGVIPDDAVQFGSVFLLLAGYATENAAKALLIQQKGLKVKTDRLPRQLDRHGTERLLKECGVALSPEEVEFVRRLDTAVEWAGRYPIPKSVQKMQLVRFTGSADSTRLRDLIARLEGLIRPRKATL